MLVLLGSTVWPGILGTLALSGGEAVDKPEGDSGGPVATEVGDRVEQGHVGAPYGRVTHSRVERHQGHEDAVHCHL